MCKSLTGFQVEVFESCYKPHFSAVGIVGPHSAEIISSLQFRGSYSVILIDKESKYLPGDTLKYYAFQNELQIFMISIPKVTWKMKYMFEELSTLQWWNQMASFLIIDNPILSDWGCLAASGILDYAQKQKLLNAKFICHHKSKGPLIYSHNPYTDQAPIPWRLQESLTSKRHLWTLFVRNYHQDKQKTCKDLDFDQTKDLGGHEIRAGLILTSKLERQCAPTIIIASYIFSALNSKTRNFEADYPYKLLNHIYPGDHIDIILNLWVLNENITVQKTYPVWRFELAFITQHRGNLPQIEKLLRVIDRFSRYGVVIVCFITFFFFKFFLRQSVTSAILTIVRLICNAGIPNPPNIVATRIYLTGLFIFVVTLQGIYQGKLASLLTKPVALPNAKTFEDLENFHYTIYGDESMLLVLKERNYSGPVVPVKHSCVEYVLRDDSAACFMKRDQLVNSAYMNDLHLSDTLMLKYFMYTVRKDWPVLKRFNLLVSRLYESNIIERVFTNDSELSFKKQKFYEKEKENQGPTVITLTDLAFAFAILGIGLSGATVVFFIELWNGWK